ncbi:MAG TPA: transposon-encoded TnpW family protein [Collinsella ihuae]|uniref:Transposon-encoded TnpW family protein n=1 Tax=Collinsella ihumii TaxID=1720204 RepID=A0A921IPV4_9ACTN|nr:transposon-encoded TnpW family protein [Collinsella ihumii]
MQDRNSVSSGKKPQENPLKGKTTYRFGNRSFVVESVFKEESPDTLGSVLLRLMKAEHEKL